MFDYSGAKNVISACRECRVKRLVYNSSADVVFDGLHDIRNGDESLGYPWKVRFRWKLKEFLFPPFNNFYIGEQMINFNRGM